MPYQINWYQRRLSNVYIRSVMMNFVDRWMSDRPLGEDPNEDPKTGNILYSRLRTEMAHLNSHLFQLQKHTTAECSCGHPVENVRHFVLSCPNYSAQRIQLVLNISKIIGIDFCDLSPTYQLHLLLHGGTMDDEGGCALAYHFQNFVISSHRFAHL